jgi:hypothetical protein
MLSSGVITWCYHLTLSCGDDNTPFLIIPESSLTLYIWGHGDRRRNVLVSVQVQATISLSRDFEDASIFGLYSLIYIIFEQQEH